MYDINSVLIAVVLLISMVAAIEAGYLIGLKSNKSANEDAKAHVNAVQASILGILALLLGFTLSLSLQRFDNRSEAVVDEANAIGTAYLRAQLLPSGLRNNVQSLLRSYLDLRVDASALSIVNGAEREIMLAKTLQSQSTLWDCARQAAQIEPNPVTSGLFIQALNELIDNFGKRDAAINRHVPEVVLLLLYGTFLMTGGIVGFTCGIAGHRPSPVSYIMITLIVVLVFIILDLDRPRRGFITVSQKSLVDLQTAINVVGGSDNRQLHLGKNNRCTIQ